MGEIKYQTETDEYSSPRALTFRGPPYGIVTDFIIARGLAKTRRQAELRLVLITILCFAIVALLFLWGSSGSTEAPVTPEQAEEMQA